MMYLSMLISPDNPLPIPAPVPLLEVLIVLTFILHIVFVNFTISLTAGAVVLEILGIAKENPVYDAMAKISSTHASIHKSIAVVLGVAPLLMASVIYTQYFYASTILIGEAWLSILWLLIIAFLLLYLYKFTWDKWQHKKALHLSVGIAAMAILCFIPLIFIVNVVSMLHPELWSTAQGFFHSLFHYPQIWQRYLHFMLASLATGGFYFFIFYSFKKRKASLQAPQQALKIFGVKVGLWITIVQLVSGFILLFSFKRDIRMLYLGDDMLLTGLLVASIVLTLILCVLLFTAAQKDSGKAFSASLLTFVLILAIMGWMRHELREAYLAPYLEDNPRTEQRAE